jgi:hypothetical protein
MNETSLTTPPATSTTTTSTKDGDGAAVGRSRRVAVVVEHWIQPSDTFQGICLLYGVTSTQLRRANYGFSGTNLSLAPNPLRIPNPLKVPVTSTLSTTKSMTSISDTDTENNTDNDTSNNNINSNDDPTPAPPPPSLKEDPYLSSLTVSYFLRRSTEENPTHHPPLAETEARCYLELNEWNVSAALSHYRKDLQRKQEEADDPHGEVARFDTPLEFVVMDEECT